jgi:RNA polymerase sigma-70 factor (ECF subfamily)
LTGSPDASHAYARYFPPIRAKCRRLLGEAPAAEDVAQEALLRLWKSGVAEGGDARTVMAWLYRTCTRLAIDVLRERRRTGGQVGVAATDVDATPCRFDVGACVEARAMIAALAGTVPEDELTAVILCRVDGLSQPEAAEVLGVAERTIRRMLDRFDARTEVLRKELTS